MSLGTMILGLIIILGFYLFVSEYYLKRRLNIKSKSKGVFSKGRKSIFIVIEVTLMIIFIIATFTLGNYFPYSPMIRSLPFPIFFFLIYFFRGIEEWIVKKSDKSYYHEWLVSITFLIVILFITFGEFVSAEL
ncbi:DUF4181 domain-containing protein [Bacillus tuaregi]|uniref:DUF4181 domain-containing protein n=1 Tax=Bacillus tuaregi TaxID=1816695 RepID=UPI0008F94A0F|nr:DUF4181 domain-containing protein [Bacillus tuaregi]